MRANLLLLIGVILLYLIPSLIFEGIYGKSYGFMSGQDRWRPDDRGGWVKQGNPKEPMPTEPSVNIPLAAQYAPYFLPGLLLAVFLLTPLSRKLEERRPGKESEPAGSAPPDETPPDEIPPFDMNPDEPLPSSDEKPPADPK